MIFHLRLHGRMLTVYWDIDSELFVFTPYTSENSMCASSWLSCVSMSFKNYSSMPGSSMSSSRGCLEGVTDS